MTPDRRAFLRSATETLAGGVIAAVALPLAESCARAEQHKPRSFETTVDVSALVTNGASLIPPAPGIDGFPILVIRTGEGKFTALSSQCSHMGCPVHAPVNGVIVCPCHGSRYDLSGKVLQGPAEFALPRYDTALEARGTRLVVFVEA